MPPKGPGFGRCIVTDRDRFFFLVEQVVAANGGNPNAAAAKLGISQPTLNRYCPGHGEKTKGQAGPLRVAQTTMAKLERALEEIDIQLAGEKEPAWEFSAQLGLCVLPPAALRLYRTGFLAWCDERNRRFSARNGGAWKVGSNGTLKQIRKRFRRVQLDFDLRRVYRLARAAYKDVFEDFEKFAKAKGVPAERVHVAITRTLEPLAEVSASAHFEPAWNHLDREEQRLFLWRGFRQEKTLLSGPHPLEVAKRLSAGLDPRPSPSPD
jgi:hypothetical protein